jgi:hypothetical protein
VQAELEACDTGAEGQDFPGTKSHIHALPRSGVAPVKPADETGRNLAYVPGPFRRALAPKARCSAGLRISHCLREPGAGGSNPLALTIFFCDQGEASYADSAPSQGRHPASVHDAKICRGTQAPPAWTTA